jgi:uncharacterized protein (TIGR03083 family)
MTLEHEYDVFVSATNSFVDLVRQIEATSWTSPGLGEWDLRALVGHTSRSLITVTQYVDQPVDDEDLDSSQAYYLAAAAMIAADQAAVVERGRQAGDALGADPAAAVADLARSAIARLHDQPDVLMHTIVGGMWLRHYLPTRTFELAVHSLDIAKSIGAGFRPEPEVLSAAVALAGRIAVLRGDGVELLLGLTGRGGLGQDFSVV